MSDHPALPPRASRPWVATAALAFLVVVVVERGSWGVPLAGIPVLVMAWRRRPYAAATLAVVALAALFGNVEARSLPEGELDQVVTMATGVREGRFGPWALVDLGEGLALANLSPEAKGRRGDRVRLTGRVVGPPGEAAGRRHRGVIAVDRFQWVGPPPSLLLRAGNAVRDRVTGALGPLQGGRALLAGFLVGDTTGLDPVDEEAMRRAGLAHFTAVSGSNVALFLLLVYVLAGPLALGPRRRAVVGLAVLPVFAAATGFEPSVLRAATMAGLVLAGRLRGLAMESWQVLSVAVIGLLVADPAMAGNVGFQLSVAATAGVMVGGRWPGLRSPLSRALAVTSGAQLAVGPLLVAGFGRVPLLSPLVNLAAAPLVSVSTLLGAVGVIGLPPLVDLAAGIAAVVLWLARAAAPWPQLGWVGLLSVTAAVTAWTLVPALREWLAIGGAAVVAFVVLGAGAALPDPGLVVLDVGQGDAILLDGGGGRLALVDGGPDPVLLLGRLQEYGVRRLDLVVLSHVHADHIAGLTALPGRIPIGMLWERTDPHVTEVSTDLLTATAASGTPVYRPRPGEVWQLGALRITVEGPLRRYDSPNDQSIVLTVEGPAATALLTGDIETRAQGELAYLRADVLKVPHQGAATSDPEWLQGVGASLAVISVGENDFGHPVPWVVESLESGGAEVLRTDQMGDVVIPLGEMGD